MKNFFKTWWKALVGAVAGIGIGVGGDYAVRGIKKHIQAKKEAKEFENVDSYEELEDETEGSND
ncbi:MAG: hypothetical protein J6Y02_11775 [Pseudobutyrivibrio sp.]|nr:hypothetical protein [Lachnospiraceae bacterium]MBP5596053.1 hypothetical protein [Pseudobutyrivibrio sp.]